MTLTFKQLHPAFVGEASPFELRQIHDDATLAAIRDAMNRYAVLVFHDQRFTDDEHLAFAQRLDGALHTKLGSASIQKNRFGNEALAHRLEALPLGRCEVGEAELQPRVDL